MIKIKTIEDIYPAVDELIKLLNKNSKQQEFSKNLQHKMYKVSWTTGLELYEELSKIFKNFIKTNDAGVDILTIDQIKKIIKIIDEYIKNYHKQIIWKK